jgi:hypothetical protein
MHRGEILGLTLDRIALGLGTIRVDRQLARSSRGGQSIKVLQALLGHKSAVETWDTYGHRMGDEDDRSRAVIDAALGGREPDGPVAGSGDRSGPRKTSIVQEVSTGEPQQDDPDRVSAGQPREGG